MSVGSWYFAAGIKRPGESNKTGAEVAAPLRTPGNRISFLTITVTLHVPYNCAAATIMDVVWRIGLQQQRTPIAQVAGTAVFAR
ncbi:hypothetical protein J6590_075045 [Homalodisca vitripennis]|nr:hypothetical protein J6590_075045 [Homalodisca vitripennis]